MALVGDILGVMALAEVFAVPMGDVITATQKHQKIVQQVTQRGQSNTALDPIYRKAVRSIRASHETSLTQITNRNLPRE